MQTVEFLSVKLTRLLQDDIEGINPLPIVIDSILKKSKLKLFTEVSNSIPNNLLSKFYQEVLEGIDRILNESKVKVTYELSTLIQIYNLIVYHVSDEELIERVYINLCTIRVLLMRETREYIPHIVTR